MTTPRPAARIAREPARAGGKFVLNGHRRANCAGTPYIASKPDQIRMRDYSIGDFDREIISRVASPSLRHENEIPRTVVRRAGFRDGNQDDKAARGRRICEKLLRYFLQSCRHRLQRTGIWLSSLFQNTATQYVRPNYWCTVTVSSSPFL